MEVARAWRGGEDSLDQFDRNRSQTRDDLIDLVRIC